jgi:hypothetical protein
MRPCGSREEEGWNEEAVSGGLVREVNQSRFMSAC